MSTFKRVLQELEENKSLREQGKDIVIPWIDLPKLGSIIPGIQKEKYCIITANAKVGKTQLTDFLFLYQPYKYITTRKTNLKLKVFYFTLEMSKEEKVRQAIVNKIYEDKKIILSSQLIQSYFQEYILSDEMKSLIEKYEPYFERFEQSVEYIDHIRNPFGIYKHIRDYANRKGKYYDKNNVLLNQDLIAQGNEDTLKNISHYIPNDPDERVIVITDHIGLLKPEKGASLHEAMSKYSNEYCLAMRDRWKYTIVNVQQQAAEQEKQQFTYKGESVHEKLRPSPDGLGDCKLTARDVNYMFGLFCPFKYKIQSYNQYDISRLKDKYREFSVILNREGSGFININLGFNGAVNHFYQLESPGEIKYQ